MTAFQPGARVCIPGGQAIVRSHLPEGSSSFAFPHYKVDVINGDTGVVIHVDRVTIEPVKPRTFSNPHRISAREYFKRENCLTDDQRMALLETIVHDGGCTPALCDEGCETDPDGDCQHGCPSILRALQLI